MAAETIVAIATAPGRGGIGIVRASGPAVADLTQRLIGRVPSARHATLATVHDGAGQPIDQGIVVYFAKPDSFTGEDVLELQVHGSPVVLDLILARCLELGARLARPGEFSERAFLNGKLDLVQAEAIADLIESSTALAARLAGRSLQGVFSRLIDDLVERLIRMRMGLEATLDFPDEELDLPNDLGIGADLTAIIADTSDVIASAHQGQVVRDGLAVVIAGPPNAGKSSLLNALSGQESAIVTPVAGTTRDTLALDIQIDGLPIRIIDTAGLRHSDDIVEREGIRRARAQAEQADLILWVYDATTGPDPLTRAHLPTGIAVTRVRNKIDLLGLQPNIMDVDTGPEIAISATNGAGLDLLRAHLKERAGLGGTTEGAFVARRRHLDALRRGLDHLESARYALTNALGAELIAEDLQQAQHAFGEITGRVTSDDLLGRIFSSFCIGK
ncbi:MAG: tRNA uridine-5-carboxymethylaminomethyl(34) synthesis GTPase MnmE [Sphingobacteriia bacterium]|nr:tRNA uridine-5-carboxymethylaminomethyl(34) synthesis GTPase MnmE [Sphingobacteriia bacterium]NCC38703.1 tRNA uridine-5-carboxymethylaminomethyl(34) synthesis GTPase MnmE [Gammaproteobacteria bacterium]